MEASQASNGPLSNDKFFLWVIILNIVHGYNILFFLYFIFIIIVDLRQDQIMYMGII